MPGEHAGAIDEPVLAYLSALEAFDKRFPGFEHDIHGVERNDTGDYLVECLEVGHLQSSRQSTAKATEPASGG
jgi:arginine decarboxylase